MLIYMCVFSLYKFIYIIIYGQFLKILFSLKNNWENYFNYFSINYSYFFPIYIIYGQKLYKRKKT